MMLTAPNTNTKHGSAHAGCSSAKVYFIYMSGLARRWYGARTGGCFVGRSGRSCCVGVANLFCYFGLNQGSLCVRCRCSAAPKTSNGTQHIQASSRGVYRLLFSISCVCAGDTQCGCINHRDSLSLGFSRKQRLEIP
jgi:hypothetical protein